MILAKALKCYLKVVVDFKNSKNHRDSCDQTLDQLETAEKVNYNIFLHFIFSFLVMVTWDLKIFFLFIKFLHH